MKVSLTQDDGTTREVETTQALVIYQEGDEIAVMGECNSLFIQIIEAADIIGQSARKQVAALAVKQGVTTNPKVKPAIPARSGTPALSPEMLGGGNDWDERDLQRGYRRGYDYRGTDSRE